MPWPPGRFTHVDIRVDRGSRLPLTFAVINVRDRGGARPADGRLKTGRNGRDGEI